MERGIAETQGASLTDTEDIDRASAMAFADHIHTVLDIAVDIVVERQPPIASAGVPPINQIYVHAEFEQVAHQGSVFLQVHHVRAVHERVHDEDRHPERLLHHRGEAIQNQIVFPVNLFFGAGPDVNVLLTDPTEILDPLENLLVEVDQFASGLVRIAQ